MATQNDATVAAASEAVSGHYPNYDQDVGEYCSLRVVGS
jgi:hypothetical protein